KRTAARQALRGAAFSQVLGRPAVFRAASAMARVYQRSGLQRLVRRSGALRVLSMERLDGQLPRMSPRFVVPSGQVYSAEGERVGRAALLTGCIMSTAYARVHEATIWVLRRNGWEVALPRGQGCCGALHAHSGDLGGGRDLLCRNIAAFESCGADVVVS